MSLQDDLHESYSADKETVVPTSTSIAPLATSEQMAAKSVASSAKKKPPKAGLGSFFRVLTYATPFEAAAMTVAAFCAAGSGIALPSMIIFFGRIVNSFNDFAGGGGLSSANFSSQFSNNSLYIVYLFIGKFVLGYISTFAFRMSGIRISATIRRRYMESLFRQPVSAVDKLPPGLATDNLGRVANTIQFSVSEKLALLVSSLAMVIAGYVIAFVYSWQLTLALSSAVVFSCLIMGIIVPLWLGFEARINHENGSASGLAGEALKNVRTVKSLCAEAAILKNYLRHVEEAQRLGIRMTPVTAFQISPVYFALYSSMALALWLGVKLYVSGTVPSFLNIIVAFSSVTTVVGAVGGLVGPIEAIVKAAAASISIFRVIDAPQRKLGGKREPDANAGEDVWFQDVRFTYPSRPTSEILQGMSLHFPAGKVTALVGPSGCGKSTIVGLMERWYQLSDVNEELIPEEKPKTREEKTAKNGIPKSDETAQEPKPSDPILQNAGSICVGEDNIETLDLKWWRAQIGLVQQEPHLFNESIYDNVVTGLTGSRWESESDSVKMDLVRSACKDAFADEFVQRLPRGYNTQVGESAIQLSGGQRQRLAIARAIVRQPKILILDEATSSIDVRSERIVQAAINRASTNRTTIMIAHRLSTIRTADQIVVVRDGRAMESGTHDALLAKPEGLYAQMVAAQQLNMLEDATTSRITEAAAEKADELPDQPDEDIAKENKATTASFWTKVLRSVGLKPDKEDDNKDRRQPVRSIARVLYELRDQGKFLYLLVAFGASGAGSMYALQSYLLSNFLTVFIQPRSPQMVDAGSYWALRIFALALGVAAAFVLLSISMNILSVITAAKYAREYFANILGKGISWFDGEDKSSGSLTAQLSSDPKQLQQFIGLGVVVPLVSVTGIVGCIIIAFYFGWKLSIVVFGGALPVLILSSFIRVRYDLVFADYNAEVFLKSSKFAADGVAAFRTVAALTLEQHLQSKYEALLRGHVDAAFKKARFACLIFALSDSVDLLCIALTTWYGGTLLSRGEYGPLQFYIIYYALIQGGQAVGQTLAFLTNISNAAEAANRIMQIRAVDMEDRPTGNGSEVIGNEKAGLRVQFVNVSFSYPSRQVLVYTNFNLTVESGQYIAIVGQSGCGKTTTASMLSRFYKPTQGRILIDGHDMQNIPITDYRQSIALVSQEPTLFEGTISENLRIGLPNAANIPTGDVEDACRAADIHDFIISLPQGYATQLKAGTHSSLSGGQKQRLCIARALLRKPRMLLLDEATSSLDSRSEKMVQLAVERVAQRANVTIVAIAHRLATIQGADRIILLGPGGTILESGNHSELIARRGLYFDVCKAQALS